MKRWVKLGLTVVILFSAIAVVRAEPQDAGQYDLYSWKEGNDWSFSLQPAAKETRVDAEIRQADTRLRGKGKLKEKILNMREGDVIFWRQKAESNFVYPQGSVIEEIQDYAKGFGVKVNVAR